MLVLVGDIVLEVAVVQVIVQAEAIHPVQAVAVVILPVEVILLAVVVSIIHMDIQDLKNLYVNNL